MSSESMFEGLAAPLAEALGRRGFTALTPVQQAVLDPELAGRDLRISSQTGSGKTVAVGLVLAPELDGSAAPPSQPPSQPARGARPAVIVIAPTRELAMQLGKELTWLYAPLGAGVTVVTGGASYPVELRALRNGPRVVVGTPGRLVDHLDRGAIDASAVSAVVLDEADQLLDLGFREAIDSIFAKTPAERRTHLVSATFSREVLALAARHQTDPIAVQGTPIGDANEDITHVAHLVHPGERDDALLNLLLLAPGERALVFVRTRADASDLADRLSAAGLPAAALSGDLEQRDRTRVLAAFRSGAVTTLVATDVAARGIDVPEVGRVIHADPPGDAEALTHRSGRTGRAGRKGVSVVLVPPAARMYVQRLYRLAKVTPVWTPIPGPAEVQKAADARLAAELGAEVASPADPRFLALAAELLAAHDPAAVVAALLARSGHAGPCAPRPVTAIEPPPPQAAAPRAARPQRGDSPKSSGLGFVPFRINWGGRHGADARRLLAMVCRRGEVRSDAIGAIRIGPTSSTFEVSSPLAGDFARSARRPDTRDPRIRIEPFHDGEAQRGPRPRFAKAQRGEDRSAS